VSVPESDRQRPADAVAGLLAAAAIFTALIAVAYRPVRVAPFAIVVSLVAVAMSKRYERLGQAALGISTACWITGMIVAVVTNHPLF